MSSIDTNEQLNSRRDTAEEQAPGTSEVKQDFACRHPRSPVDSEGPVQSPIGTKPAGAPRIFALIIGINDYQSISKLQGCVNDSENICSFLTDRLGANPAHIKHLRDSQATRQNIISAFKEHLIENPDIMKNDAILFYFSGHGSYEKPPKDLPAWKPIETICPYDDRTSNVRGIPDLQIISLIRKLATRKGNNIAAIYDSCHSGGMSRIPESELENARGIDPPESPYPTDWHQYVAMDDDTAGKGPTRHDTQGTNSGTSFVTLAACQDDELAHEALQSEGYMKDRYGGRFTSLLLDLFRDPSRNLEETTYIGLHHSLLQQEHKLRLSKQTPYVDGDNQTRIIFKTRGHVHHFPVLLEDDGSFSVAAGAVHGVEANKTKFIITSGDDRHADLKPHTVSSLRSSFHSALLNGKTLQDDSRAEIPGLKRSLSRLLLTKAANDPSKREGQDVVISLSTDRSWKVERRDQIIPHYAEPVVLFGLSDQQTRNGHKIYDVVAHFTYHLLQNHSNVTDIGDGLGVKLELLSEVYAGRNITYKPVDNGRNFFGAGNRAINVSGYAEFVPDDKERFSLTLSIKNEEEGLFPYVFGFDPNTYGIDIFYHPANVQNAPLRDGQDITIGYGHGGKNPIRFHPNEVTFFKIFVTSTYVDLKGLVQDGIHGHRKLPDRPSALVPDFCESWIYVVKN